MDFNGKTDSLRVSHSFLFATEAMSHNQMDHTLYWLIPQIKNLLLLSFGLWLALQRWSQHTKSVDTAFFFCSTSFSILACSYLVRPRFSSSSISFFFVFSLPMVHITCPIHPAHIPPVSMKNRFSLLSFSRASWWIDSSTVVLNSSPVSDFLQVLTLLFLGIAQMCVKEL